MSEVLKECQLFGNEVNITNKNISIGSFVVRIEKGSRDLPVPSSFRLTDDVCDGISKVRNAGSAVSDSFNCRGCRRRVYLVFGS